VPQGDGGAAAPRRGPARRPGALGDLPEQARDWERRVDELAAEDSEVAEYIAALEQREPADELPEASGEAIAKEFERYLKRGGDEG
jgi:hypothetical protein